MAKLSELKSDPNAAEWIDCPELGADEGSGEPVALHVRSINYPPYRVDLAATRLRLAREYPGDQIVPPEVEDKENGRLAAKHLLIGWRHIDDDDDKPLAFDAKTALAALVHPAPNRLRDATLASARVVGARRAKQRKDIEGNSKPASDSN